MTLYISSMMPDRSLEESELSKGITNIAASLARSNQHLAQKRAPILDIVLLLPSRLEKAEFTGMRLHSFDRSEQILRIEASIPENMVRSSHAERYVIALMQDAVDAAREYFLEQNILFDAAGHMALIDFIAPRQKQMALN